MTIGFLCLKNTSQTTKTSAPHPGGAGAPRASAEGHGASDQHGFRQREKCTRFPNAFLSFPFPSSVSALYSSSAAFVPCLLRKLISLGTKQTRQRKSLPRAPSHPTFTAGNQGHRPLRLFGTCKRFQLWGKNQSKTCYWLQNKQQNQTKCFTKFLERVSCQPH